jgi:hypothetical protein
VILVTPKTGPTTVNSSAQNPATAELQPYVRPRHIPVEPVVFAALLLAVVSTLSTWATAPSAGLQQAAPEHSQTVAVAPRS